VAIEFLCPRCQTEFNVSDEDAGTKQRCPHCQTKVRVPIPEKLASREHAPASLPLSGGAIEFVCPRCQTAMQVPAEKAGSKQRCPKCQGKVRIPDAIAAPAPRSMIEFKCPRCDESIRARGEHAGVKQFCPRCGGKVRVPTPQIPLPEYSADGRNKTRVPAPVPVSPGVEALAAITTESHNEIPWTRPKRRRRSKVLGLLIPVWCIGVIAGIGAWLMQKPPVKLEGNLTGERLTDLELGPFRVNHEYVGKSKDEAKAVFERLENEPIRASSQLLTLEFKGSASGISLLLRTAEGAEFYRVDPGPDKLLAKYLDDHRSDFKTAVQDELTRSVPEFLAAVEKRGDHKTEFPGLAEFRDSVGLASLVSGFGYYVQAAIGKQAYPCILEDKDGRLFFVLPEGTKEFEIVGRDRGGKTSKDGPRFPGRFWVQVSKKSATINQDAPDPKEKIRKALNR
jgi:DNA-directed RNA polymerase subunit RPC12/RpoP